jgi:hypothetical protein
MSSLRPLALALLFALVGGCPSASPGGAPDAGAGGGGLPPPDAADVEPGDDAGAPEPTDAGSVDAGSSDAGSLDAGSSDAGSLDAGSVDAGAPDAGAPFSWTDLFDGGPPAELSCLPDTLPDLSLSGFFDVLGFSPYYGAREPGVKCGNTTCAVGVPCCLLCGYAACADAEEQGKTSCPAFTRPIACDGPEDCGGENNTCCYTLTGADCRPASECGFDLSLPSLDGGLSWAGPGGDAGAPSDGGEAHDGGDGGEHEDAGEPQPGDPGFDFSRLFDQGFKVCTTSLPFLGQCDLFSGELCCTSKRWTEIDLGVCIPAALCLGSALP